MINFNVPEKLKHYENLIESTYRYSNEITFKCEDTKPWESKLGGCPYLYTIDEYPVDEQGNPMLFLSQINFEDIKNIDELPKKGILQFFVANDDTYGLEEKIQVKFIENIIKDESKLISKNPYEDNDGYKYNLPFSRNGRMYFELRQMPMSSSIDLFEKTFEDKFTEDEFKLLRNECYASDSRVGGYPYFVQYDYINFSDETFLLLQLDIDDNCEIMFGDSGNCTFTISKEDLKKRDFSKVTYDWQCC